MKYLSMLAIMLISFTMSAETSLVLEDNTNTAIEIQLDGDAQKTALLSKNETKHYFGACDIVRTITIGYAIVEWGASISQALVAGEAAYIFCMMF